MPPVQPRRRPGEVRDAIVEVLKGHRGDASIDQIHAGVERVLGGKVARSSVRSYLQLGSEGGGKAQFERTGRGRYKARRR